MELLLLRHAKSDWSSGVRSDHARPLNARGQAAAPRMGRFLREQGLQPHRTLCSTATRTRETWALLSAQWDQAGSCSFEEAIYEASPHSLRQLISQALAPQQRLLLIGHNPGLQSLLHQLLAQPLPAEQRAFPTCALAHLRLQDNDPLAAHSAELLHLQYVRALDA